MTNSHNAAYAEQTIKRVRVVPNQKLGSAEASEAHTCSSKKDGRDEHRKSLRMLSCTASVLPNDIV